MLSGCNNMAYRLSPMSTPTSMQHQRVAVEWMLRREAKTNVPRGGILADDMGLGTNITYDDILVMAAH